MITKTALPHPVGQGPQKTVPAMSMPWGSVMNEDVADIQPPRPKAK